MRSISLLLSLLLASSATVRAQFFIVSSVHRPADDSLSVYSLSIRNTSNDSILVVHSQETEDPPFINRYRYELFGEDSICIYLGKSTNPLIPETYRATKTFASHSVNEIYFSIPKKYAKRKKHIDIWYYVIDERFEVAFNRLDRIENSQNIERCRKLKERYGKVYHKQIYY